MSDSPLFTRPRFFKNVTFHRHTDRSVGWLELFYDLVYVATLIQIGNFLSDNLTLIGLAQFLVILTVVWWAWTGETFYQNRFVVDDLIHRGLVFTQIFAIASLGLSVSGAFGALYVQFTIAYVITRLVLVVMHIRAARAHPESAALSRGYAIGFLIGIAAWLGSLLLPADFHWVGWLVGIAIELSVPLMPALRTQQIEWGVDVHHITERFGIFTIIVLGESFVKILDDAQGTMIGLPLILFSTVGLLVVYALWWLYFSDTDGKTIDFSSRIKPPFWVYSHLPLAAGLVAFGVGAKKLFAWAAEHPGEAAKPEYRLIYTAAIVFYLVALTLIDLSLEDDDGYEVREATVHLISAIFVGVIGFLWVGASAFAFVAVVAVIMVGQVGFSIISAERNG